MQHQQSHDRRDEQQQPCPSQTIKTLTNFILTEHDNNTLEKHNNAANQCDDTDNDGGNKHSRFLNSLTQKLMVFALRHSKIKKASNSMPFHLHKSDDN